MHHYLAKQPDMEAPAPSTITAILRRHGLLAPEPPRRDCLRIERAGQ